MKSLGSELVRDYDDSDDEAPNREIFAPLDAIDEEMWRRVRSALYGGPDCAAPASLERFERHCQLKQASSKDEWFDADNKTRLIKTEQEFPGLTAKPIWDAREFEWIEELVHKHYDDITREVRRQQKKKNANFRELFSNPYNTSGYDSGWGMIHLKHPQPDCDKLCPRHLFRQTFSAIEKVKAPIGTRYASVARQRAQKVLRTHNDMNPMVLTCHLPLYGPNNEEAYMIVNGTKSLWLPKVPTVIDTTYYHSAHNDHPTDDMYLLHIDFFHPDLTPDEKFALSLLHRHNEQAILQRQALYKPIVSKLEDLFRASPDE